MYRLNVTDKFAHVLSRLQCLLSSSWKVTPVPLPTNIELTDVSPNMVTSLKLADKLNAKYNGSELTFALTFKMEDANTVCLLGIGERNWMNPALSFDQALTTGMSYKSFQLIMATTTSSGAMPGRLSSVVETIQISIGCLQQQLPAEDKSGVLWCNYLITLPPRYYEYQDEFCLPDWFSDRCIDRIIKEIIKSRRLVNIAQPDPIQPGDNDKKEKPPIRTLPTIECRRGAGHLNNVYNITNNVENMTIKGGKDEQDDHRVERRSEYQAEEARAMRQSTGYLGARKKTFGNEVKSDLLDSSIPSLPTQELILPRQITPPRQVATAPPFPSQPYPWLHSAENPGWSKNQQQQPANVDWHSFVQLEEQMKEKARFAEFQGNIEKAIDKRSANRRENLYEEIAEKDPSTVKPLYQIEIPSQYKHVFEKAPMSSTPVKPSSVEINLPPPNVISSLHIREPEKSVETQSWSGLSFLGPRFPSLPPDLEDEHAPKLEDKKQIETLRQITEQELGNITELEGQIQETLYGTRTTQGPCSLLADQRVVAATQCPSVLPGSRKDRIMMMRQILEMMENKKKEHTATLKYLQDRNNVRDEHDDQDVDSWDAPDDNEEERRRISNRLQNKTKHDYHKMNRRGFY